MVRKSIRKVKVWHWIPPPSTAAFSLTVTRTDGTVDDVSSIINSYVIEDGKTSVIGRFEFELWNPNGTYTDVWANMNEVSYYSDYAADATTRRFKGYIEKISYRDNKIRVSGRSIALKLQERNVTQQYLGVEASEIFKDLIDKYGSEFTYTNVNVTTVYMTVDWYEKDFWECVIEICRATGNDAYLDADGDFHFVESGSVLNSGEAFVHGYNILEIGEFAEDSSFVKNKITVYGATVEGIQIIATAKDTTSQDTYGIREEKIYDDNMTNQIQAQDYADYLLAQKKDAPQTGEITGIMLASIQPAEYIYLTSPDNNIQPLAYDILNYKHKYSSNKGFTTTVNVNKEPRRFSQIMKSLIENDNKLQTTSTNPFEMEYTFNHYFNTDSGTHTNTEITNGVLKPTGASGTWISDSKNLSSDISSAYLIVNGETLTGVTVYVSGNNGQDWEVISNKSKIDIILSIGDNLKVKVVFNNADTQINSLSVQHK